MFFRLLLLGGCSGFFKNMKTNKIKPDIKVFTQLLEIIPSTLVAEKVIYFSFFIIVGLFYFYITLFN